MSEVDETEFTKLIETLGASNVAVSVDTFTTLKAANPKAITIFAEGDSWFAYPRDNFLWGKNANIIHWLKDRTELIIRAVPSNGDEAVAMVSGSSKFKLLKGISDREYDVLLFSGGGNDIVGAYDFDYFITDRKQVASWEEGIRKDRFERRLISVLNAYQDLLDYVADFSKNPNMVVVSHTYDLPDPSPTGATFVGGLLKYDGAQSWMYPYLMEKNFTDRTEQKNIVGYMLGEFAKKLIALEAASQGRFVVVRTQNQLGSHEWRNEIHPDSVGFQRIADKIYYDALKPIYLRKNGLT